MQNGLSLQALEAAGIQVAILGLGLHALPVRLRVRQARIECRVPAWSDLLAEPGEAEVTLVALLAAEPALSWLFVRGIASCVAEPDWADLLPPIDRRFAPEDLYRLIRIEPKRIERVDEGRGWGIRETLDL